MNASDARRPAGRAGPRAGPGPAPEPRDACGILGGITPEPAPLLRFVEMLGAMGHRGGDGAGLLFRVAPEDLEREAERAPWRAPWASPEVARDGLVLSLQVPAGVTGERAVACTREVLARHALDLAWALPVSQPTPDAEGVRTWRAVARDAAPPGRSDRVHRTRAARRELEARAGSDGLPPSFYPASFSCDGMALYKLVGSLDDFSACFGRDELARLQTNCFLGHVRYSTNTLPRHRSAQPFGLLAHNGEITDIGAVRRVMNDLGIPLSRALSDSSDLDVLLDELRGRHGLALSEALRLLLPDRWARAEAGSPDADWLAWLARASRAVRAEGPAALVASDGRGLVGAVDSLGLRPLSLVRTQDGGAFFASEAGAVAPLAEVARIQRLRPGEMLAATWGEDGVEVTDAAELAARMRDRRAALAAPGRAMPPPPCATAEPAATPREGPERSARLAAAGFSRRIRRQLEALFLEGRELGSGTGWRGGLAVLRGPGARLADALHAMTAQVTAPTLSAEHERAAMDARVVLGAAPSLGLAAREGDARSVALALPLVLPDPSPEQATPEEARAVREAAARLGATTVAGLRERAGPALAEIDAHVDARDEAEGAARLRRALARVCEEAAQHAASGERSLLLLRADPGGDPRRAPLPPELAVGAVDRELAARGLRQRVSLLVASDAISDPHSMFVLLQLGADALVPTLLVDEALELARRRREAPRELLERGLRAATRALFISYGRIATGELAAGRGGRRVCAVGLDPEVLELLGLESGLGAGLGLDALWRGLCLRRRALSGDGGSLRALEETPVDTMPLDVALGSYALLGGFAPSPERKPRAPGQLRTAARTLAAALARRAARRQGAGDAPAAADVDDAGRLLREIAGLPVEELAELHRELYAPLRALPHGFLDSLRVAAPGHGAGGDWKAVGSGLDGRRTNQILGAISYGANNRLAHELYALVMARCGSMSNGGEGGVPDHVRALFVSARLAARGAGAHALARQLALEVPGYLDSLAPEMRLAHCQRLLRSVPEDFAASRFEQVSTARFGVDAYALHDARFLEIKIGQGAKPGVGGSLPGDKVLSGIAITRGVNVGQTLNSPTVHHDIYSIEDLRQLVTALKTVSPGARVCVKLAAMDDLDVIALGVVKAGADFLWIDGYEGGTGSAKDAHKEHCGLPAAPVVRSVHESLVAQGMRGSYRHESEPRFLSRRQLHRLGREEQARYRWHGPRIVASGGVRSAEDALALVLAGADYVGYGDAAQNAVGCIRCERCHTGLCPSFVATNDPARSESFDAVGGDSTLTRFVELLDVGMRQLASTLGPELRHLEELVGRTDLLRPGEGAALRVEPGFFEPVREGDPRDAARLAPQRDVVAVRRGPARRLDGAFGRWRREIRAALREQGVDPDDANALAWAEPGALRLPEPLRRLELELEVDNRDRLLGTGVVHDFVALRRLVQLATGQELELALRARGSAGSGFGMFAVHGMDLTLVGSGGDYLAEAVNGASLFVLPGLAPDGSPLAGSGDAGSASAYGMRGGELHLFDQPSVRFGIRLSGGTVFVWGDPGSVEASFDARAVKPQFTGEYMTRGTLVLCRDPGENLLCAATGRDTEVLCRAPRGVSREAWARELSRRLPGGFEVVDPGPRHAALVERGAHRYRERARAAGLEAPVTPLAPGEDPRRTFHLIRATR